MEENNENVQKKNTGWIKGMILGIVIAFLALLAIGGVVFGTVAFIKYQQNKKPAVTSALLASKLEDASDLTTAEVTYNGLIHYDDGGIPFLTQQKYSMIYSATVEAGIDLSKVEIEVTDDEVHVKLPEVTVDEPRVDMDSIDFYDESFALFNWDERQDGIDAVKEAEKDCKNKADIDSLKNRACDNAKKVVSELLEDAVGDREVIVE